MSEFDENFNVGIMNENEYTTICDWHETVWVFVMISGRLYRWRPPTGRPSAHIQQKTLILRFSQTP